LVSAIRFWNQKHSEAYNTRNYLFQNHLIFHKNIGNTIITHINQKMKNSPITKSSHQFRLKKDKEAALRKMKTQTVQFKRRRRHLFDRKLNKNYKTTQKEGICYESGCRLDVTIDFIDQPTGRKC